MLEIDSQLMTTREGKKRGAGVCIVKSSVYTLGYISFNHTGKAEKQDHQTLTCGLSFASVLILVHASSRCFVFSFSLKGNTNNSHCQATDLPMLSRQTLPLTTSMLSFTCCIKLNCVRVYNASSLNTSSVDKSEEDKS